MQLLAKDRIETHLMAYEIYERKSKILFLNYFALFDEAPSLQSMYPGFFISVYRTVIQFELGTRVWTAGNISSDLQNYV